MNLFQDKHILITGGTGSLGVVLLRHLLGGKYGVPKRITILSRDEAKQYALRAEYQLKKGYVKEAFNNIVRFRVGDVRDYFTVAATMRGVDIVFNTAALKQVPTCEYFPFEAVRTNIEGPENILRAIETENLTPEAVIGVSTDKACKPVNVMGMTKAIQERIFLQGSMRAPLTRFLAVRYGNVLASRGSVIPLFQEQIEKGGPITLTTPEMTRFLLNLDDAVETIFEAVAYGRTGETYVPIVPSAYISDVAAALLGDRDDIAIKFNGIRPGEKTHEILVSEEELSRTILRGNYFVIASSLPEVTTAARPLEGTCLRSEYSSALNTLNYIGVLELLRKNGFIA
jgi:FlaA1/EpsC-like NDP-sugar epimerase